MPPGWLKEYFKPRPEETPPQEAAPDGAEEAPDGVSRRDFVKTGFVTGVAAGLAAGAVVAQSGPAQAQTPATPLGGQWWPSPWGPQDERGANNRMTPAKVLEAARLIKTGKIYPLGRTLEKGIPLFGERLGAQVVIPGSPTGGPFGKHNLYYHDELFVGEIGQVGSQFDGLGHIGMVAGDGEIRYDNGSPRSRSGAPTASRSSASSTSTRSSRAAFCSTCWP